MKELSVPTEGLVVWLRQFGLVKLFRTQLKDQLRHYVVLMPDAHVQETFQKKEFQELYANHWKIKQVCHVESFQVRGKIPILNHVFASLCSYIYLQKMQINEWMVNVYRWQRSLYTAVVEAFATNFIVNKDFLNPQFNKSVNA